MLPHKKLLVAILFLLCIIAMPRYSFAVNELGIGDTDVSVDTAPENPEPYQSVTINLTSYATDLNKALIEWRSGNSLVLSGVGRTSYSFTAAGPNTSTVFTIKITPSDTGVPITKQVIITPSDIDLVWQGVDSYVPPLYQGKSYISAEGLIRVVAIPNSNAVKSSKSNIVYTWKNNGKTVESASGYGKDSYVFANSEIDSKEEVTVTASSVDGSYSATKTIDIPIVAPKILFYKRSPTEGILYNTALQDDTFITEDEVTIDAVPYFLALTGNEDKFSYKWQINSADIDTPSKKTELTVHPSTRGGFATIGLTMENINTFFQKVTGQLKIDL